MFIYFQFSIYQFYSFNFNFRWIIQLRYNKAKFIPWCLSSPFLDMPTRPEALSELQGVWEFCSAPGTYNKISLVLYSGVHSAPIKYTWNERTISQRTISWTEFSNKYFLVIAWPAVKLYFVCIIFCWLIFCWLQMNEMPKFMFSCQSIIVSYLYAHMSVTNVAMVWFGLVFWYINHCWLFNAKSICIYTNSSISNNSV